VITVVDQYGDRFGVEPICRVLGYKSASTVYARRSRPPSARRLRDEEILAEINQVRIGYAACYGARRTWVELRRRQVQVARCTVERIMRSHGLVGVQRGGKAPRTTIPDRTAARPPDLVNRDFRVERPDQLWLSDITYVPTWEGFVYVAFVTDAFSRRIVGWQTADHLRTDLPLDALEMALWNRRVRSGQTVHHSDAGSQGGFNRSSQRLDHGGLRWVGARRHRWRRPRACGGSGRRIGRCVRRCGHRDGRSRLVRCSGASGGGSLRG
jgi:transposase InsO family protein